MLSQLSSTSGVAGNRVKRPAMEISVSERRPIEFLTENGFTLVRLCEINKSIPAGGLMHRFLVCAPDGSEREIIVEIDEAIAHELARRSRSRLTIDSSYWVCCAERHLAEYLWEQEDYPSDSLLTVDQPTLNDLNSARRWGTQTLSSLEAG